MMKRFFVKYVARAIVILLSFLMTNGILLFALLTVMYQHMNDTDDDLVEIVSGIYEEDGSVMASEEVLGLLNRMHAWAMILDDNGHITWSYQLPCQLKREYSVLDVAAFSRWYLEDYPVLEQVMDQGLLVVGYPTDNTAGVSLTKLYYVVDAEFIRSVFAALGVLLFADLILLIVFFLKNTKQMEKEISPILEGVQTISKGESVHMKESGELSEIHRALNKASGCISQREAARTEWIHGVSHDIRTPLSLILGYAAEMEDGAATIEVTKQAHIIRTQAEKLRDLIADLNLVSRLQYSMQPLRKEKLDLSELTREVITEFYHRGLTQQYEILPKLDLNQSYEIICDASLIRRMIWNLINNSIYHNEGGCTIGVSVMKEGNQFRVIVEDDGCGMTEKQMEQYNMGHIQSKACLEDGEIAHGLGLKLVVGVVRAHEGMIRFEAVRPHGLRIEIILPRN